MKAAEDAEDAEFGGGYGERATATRKAAEDAGFGGG
jgi:hypothetical protein